MSRRFINEFDEREDIDDIFIATDKQLRPNRNGNLYLQLRLSDRSGCINAMMWNANERTYHAFENGDYVQIRGTSQIYNGKMQIIVSQIDPAEPGSVNDADFVLLSNENRDALVKELAEVLETLSDPDLHRLAQAFLADEALMRRFAEAPAGVKHHHAYSGGLLQHVVDLVALAESVVPHYPVLNRDLLVMGVFLHDIGKVDELTYDRGLGYSDEGQLVGHLVQGVSILDRKIRDVEQATGTPFPPELAMQLKHLIVSHHGRLEFGSPKVPMTFEALTLHYLDDLDAKLHNFEQLISDDVNVDSAWTTYHPHLERKLFKGPAT